MAVLTPTSDWKGWLEALAEITRSVNESRPLRWLLDLIAETSCRLTEFDYAAVQLANAERSQLTIEAASGLSPAYIEHVNSDRPIQLQPGEYYGSPSSRAFRSGVPVSIEDTYTDPTFAPWKEIAAEQGYRSLFAVPLVYHDETIGVLACYRSDPYRVPPDVEELLKMLAGQAATAIQAAKLRARQQQRISELRAINTSLDGKTRLLEQGEQIHHRLMEAALRGRGLAEIAETLAQLAESPIAIEDSYGDLLATAGYDGRVDLPVAIREERDAAIERALQELQTAKKTVAFDAAASNRGTHVTRLLVPVVIDGQVAARLWASVAWDDPTNLKRHALESGAVIIAMELLRHRTEQTWRWRHSRDLALDLISADADEDHADLRERATSLGHDFSIPHVVIAARLDPEEGNRDGAGRSVMRDDAEAVLHFAQRSVPQEKPRPLVGRSRRSFFLLWPAAQGGSDHVGFLHNLRATVDQQVHGRSLTAVIGGTATDLSDYGRLFHTAEGALRLMQEAGRRDQVISIDHLGIYQLLLQTTATADLVAFAESVIGPLRERDAGSTTELQGTLRTYLDRGCSVKATAGALYVHPNTVTYRLQRIAQILDVDLKAPKDLLRLQWALMIDEIVALG
jgi:sugar diacid utilization regulator/GAF domain-containing protein